MGSRIEFSSDSPPSDSESTSSHNDTVTFFHQAHHFVVSGGHFTSNIMHNIPNVSPLVSQDFRAVPLGDLDLLHEIQSEPAKIRYGVSARRIYSARINGHASGMTVAVYQGDGAEEDWRGEIARYSRVRHPSFLQLYGIVSSCGLYATIFHDELTPVQFFLESYRHSPISTIYLYSYFYSVVIEAYEYIHASTGKWLDRLDCTFWIRHSTTQLCVAISPNSPDIHVFFPVFTTLPCTPTALRGQDWDSMIIASLSLPDYHECVYWYRSETHRLLLPAELRVQPGAILCGSASGGDGPVEVAFLPHCDIEDTGWKLTSGATPEALLLKNGWTRFNTSDVTRGLYRNVRYRGPRYCWLAQANHVFSHISTTHGESDYVFVDEVGYYLQPPISRNLPTGYLFLPPLENLGSGSHACEAYWASDPWGVEPLNIKDARESGISAPAICVRAWGQSWDAFIYAGLRQFYRVKGFNPEGQDVARHLGYPIYRLSPERTGHAATENKESGHGHFYKISQPHLSRLDASEMVLPSTSWKAVMVVKFTLIMISSLYQFVFSR